MLNRRYALLFQVMGVSANASTRRSAVMTTGLSSTPLARRPAPRRRVPVDHPVRPPVHDRAHPLPHLDKATDGHPEARLGGGLFRAWWRAQALIGSATATTTRITASARMAVPQMTVQILQIRRNGGSCCHSSSHDWRARASHTPPRRRGCRSTGHPEPRCRPPSSAPDARGGLAPRPGPGIAPQLVGHAFLPPDAALARADKHRPTGQLLPHIR